MSQAEVKPEVRFVTHEGKFRGSHLVFEGDREVAGLQKTTFDQTAQEYRNVNMWFASQKEIDDAILVLQQCKIHLPSDNGAQETEEQQEDVQF